MISRSVEIGSSVGLHARPAAIFSQAVDETGFDITLTANGQSVDAASLIEVMTLGVKHGETVELSCEDDSAAEALDSLVELLKKDLDA